jgi:hypothetical protein
MAKHFKKSMLVIGIVLLATVVSCRHYVPQVSTSNEEIISNQNGKGQKVVISFKRGPSHYHPSFAIWLEDTSGKYIQTLFVTNAVAKGIFEHGDNSQGKWKVGERRRPAALPYWANKRGVKSTDGTYTPEPAHPVADAYTGATPKTNFDLVTFLDNPINTRFNLLLEINQPWDWNDYWTNNKFPDDEAYKASSQPALVYEVTLDPKTKGEKKELKIIGHSHYSGVDGNLYPDTSTLTTAKDIIGNVVAEIIDRPVQHE